MILVNMNSPCLKGKLDIETSQIGDVESEDIRLLKLKGRAIEAMSYQDYLDGSAIEETILLLLL